MKVNVFLLVKNFLDSGWVSVIKYTGDNQVADIFKTDNVETMSFFLLSDQTYPILLLVEEMFEIELKNKLASIDVIKNLTIYTMKTTVTHIDHTTESAPFPLTPKIMKDIFENLTK